MLKILLHGAGGKMGRVVAATIAARTDMEIVAGVDPVEMTAAFPVYKSLADVKEKADVIIDFSLAKAVPALLQYVEATNTPVVLCTTGLTEEMNAELVRVSQKTAVFKSGNMSLGINLLISLIKKAAPILADAGFDIEVVEKHHNLKIDAPSGTALMLADAAKDSVENCTYVYDRHPLHQKRTKNEIGIHSIRGGTIVGEHDVIFAGLDEVVTLSHHAASKEVFATGAVKAARFLAGKGPGLYNMDDVL